MKTLVLSLLVAIASVAAAETPGYCVSIVAESAEGRTAAGSGTVMAKKGMQRLVLTNRHVVENSSKIFLVHEGSLVAGDRVACSESDDLAVFVVTIKLPLAKLATSSAAAGDVLHHFGSSTKSAKGTLREVIEIVEPKPRTRVMLCDKLLSIPGDSGAGVFNAKSELVGVNFAAEVPLSKSVALAVPLPAVTAFLKDYQQWDFE